MERSKAALLTQWHPAKNGALTPQQIAYGSTRKVWWICAKGHIWQAAVNTRTANHTDCPYCAGRLPWRGKRIWPANIRIWSKNGTPPGICP